jgi:hypothetical protein
MVTDRPAASEESIKLVSSVLFRGAVEYSQLRKNGDLKIFFHKTVQVFPLNFFSLCSHCPFIEVNCISPHFDGISLSKIKGLRK